MKDSSHFKWAFSSSWEIHNWGLFFTFTLSCYEIYSQFGFGLTFGMFLVEKKSCWIFFLDDLTLLLTCDKKVIPLVEFQFDFILPWGTTNSDSSTKAPICRGRLLAHTLFLKWDRNCSFLLQNAVLFFHVMYFIIRNYHFRLIN